MKQIKFKQLESGMEIFVKGELYGESHYEVFEVEDGFCVISNGEDLMALPEVMVRNGEVEIYSTEEEDEQLEQEALMVFVNLARKDVAEGKVMSSEGFKAKLKKRKEELTIRNNTSLEDSISIEDIVLDALLEEKEIVCSRFVRDEYIKGHRMPMGCFEGDYLKALDKGYLDILDSAIHFYHDHREQSLKQALRSMGLPPSFAEQKCNCLGCTDGDAEEEFQLPFTQDEVNTLSAILGFFHPKMGDVICSIQDKLADIEQEEVVEEMYDHLELVHEDGSRLVHPLFEVNGYYLNKECMNLKFS